MQTKKPPSQLVTPPSLNVEDASTVVGLCVSLLIVLAGALAYMIAFGLLLRLLHISIALRSS